MRKISKVIFIIGLLLLLLVFYFGIIANQQAASLPVYLIPLDEYPLVICWLCHFYRDRALCRFVLSKTFGPLDHFPQDRRFSDSEEGVRAFCA